ncbi:D-amino acid dehydrogenase [Janthinobacterium lividum]|uniref:D-amino acid dehydrogenase n=1 Tax=Janthinobacterium lividum TaxID=29581 RepID=UPI000873DD13|nr:D-amino acid dehydrogenase [Janthinobacterium lividum]MCC7714509.1 D-amino acid dehydrogenase [Janthinobacterium lividum]OEZ55290.1 D-amino acid dehydrogenase small subunit [Janthinobacterium lividum]WQE30289.1 D-amino acid dehydrogenase [Janthinobacterium lividum]STQ95788.1 D-amino acid dehydrogenase small subunit [Janthinobacterium lividum]
MSRVAVLGGGITGVTTAYALAKRGVGVTLIERHRYAAMETSYANGGQLSASHAEVWNHKATILNALKWMARRDAPLLLHPWPSWHKLSWFAEFLAAMPAYERNTIATARMAIAAREHLFAWAKEENIAFDHRRAGILHVYRERAGFERAAEVSRLLAQGGLERRAVTRQEMRAIEPTLQGDFYGGYYTDSDSTGDIHKFTSGLADACVRLGVACRYGAQVTALVREHGKVRISVGDGVGEDSTLFDAVVICAGTASRALAASLGDHVNVYPVKGYSITVQLGDLASRAAAPSVSLLDDATKLVSSRLGEDRLRVAGTAEFNGINHDIRADRIRPLLRWVEQCFPGINTRKVIPWAGLRPMLPDMLPKVGPGKAPGVYYNTGHGHLGWTLAAATAEMVAQQVAAVARN